MHQRVSLYETHVNNLDALKQLRLFEDRSGLQQNIVECVDAAAIGEWK